MLVCPRVCFFPFLRRRNYVVYATSILGEWERKRGEQECDIIAVYFSVFFVYLTFVRDLAPCVQVSRYTDDRRLGNSPVASSLNVRV